MGQDKSFVLNREKEIMNCFPEAWQPLSLASCEVTEPIQTSSTCISIFWAIPSLQTCSWEALSLLSLTLEQHNVGEENVSSHLVGGPWVAFERQKVLTGRNKFMGSHKRFYTATVDAEKSGWWELKQLNVFKETVQYWHWGKVIHTLKCW